MLSDDDFTAEPSGERAARIHLAYRTLFLRQLERSVRSASEGVPADIGYLVERVSGLDPARRLAPAAYAALSVLTDGLRSGNVTFVMDALQVIRLLGDGDVYATERRVESVLSEPWEAEFLAGVRTEHVDGVAAEAKILRPVLDEDPSERFAPVEQALTLLAELDPEMAAEFEEYVCRVKLFQGRGFYGFSSPGAFGAVFIRLPDADALTHFLEHTVHELSHLALNALMIHDPLLENPYDAHRAPLRTDQRPLYQIFHAAFVLGRNVRVFRRAAERGDLGFDESLDYLGKKYADGYRTVEREAKLTQRGRALFESLEPL